MALLKSITQKNTNQVLLGGNANDIPEDVVDQVFENIVLFESN